MIFFNSQMKIIRGQKWRSEASVQERQPMCAANVDDQTSRVNYACQLGVTLQHKLVYKFQVQKKTGYFIWILVYPAQSSVEEELKSIQVEVVAMNTLNSEEILTANVERAPPPKHTAEKKEACIKVAEAEGIKAAADEHCIEPSKVRYWLSKKTAISFLAKYTPWETRIISYSETEKKVFLFKRKIADRVEDDLEASVKTKEIEVIEWIRKEREDLRNKSQTYCLEKYIEKACTLFRVPYETDRKRQRKRKRKQASEEEKTNDNLEPLPYDQAPLDLSLLDFPMNDDLAEVMDWWPFLN